MPKVALNLLPVRNVIGFWPGGWPDFEPEPPTASLAELIACWQAGRLHPPIGQILPFKALAPICNRKATGKIVLRVKGQPE